MNQRTMRRCLFFAGLFLLLVFSASKTDSQLVSEFLSGVDYQDVQRNTSDEFLLALYHGKVRNFPFDDSHNVNTAFYSERCLAKMRERYEYEGNGLAIWDMFGGSNTNTWGQFKGMEYKGKGWYALHFAFEEGWGESSYYIEDTPVLYLKLVIRKGRWVIDDYRL